MKTKGVETDLGQLIARFGPADEGRMILADQSFAWIWTLDENGDGVGLARSATASGLCAQVDALVSTDYGHRKLRKLVVAERMTGNRRFHERPDLLEIEQAIDEGCCRWVAVTGFDRISRSAEAFLLFSEYLRESETDLIVTGVSSEPVDLTSPLSVISQAFLPLERQMIARRMGRAS